MRYLFLIAVLVSSTFLSAQSQKKYGISNADEDLPTGLKVGDKAPLFELESETGEFIALEEELRNGPVVLIFYRGQWCPVCSRYLTGIQDSIKYIREQGAGFLAVTPETSENAQIIKEEVGADYPIIIDSEEKVMRDYDVIFDVTNAYDNKIKVAKMTSIAKNNGQESARLPVPATYVIDTDGTIRFVQFDYDYTNRASVSMILQALQAIN